MTPSSCSSCGAPIVWAITEASGVRMPVDLHPSPGGNVRLRDQGAQPPIAIVAGATIDLLDPDDDGTRHVSHFVTCPNADDHRRK